MTSLRDQLKIDENLVLVPYQDSRGNWTVGYGHKMTNPLSVGACEVQLDYDIAQAELLLLRVATWARSLSINRYNVFVNLMFNLGPGGFMSFQKMLAAAQVGDWDTTSKELLESLYAKQVGARAVRLANLLKDG